MSEKKQITELQRFLSLLLVLGSMVGLDILVKIKGWGLTPQSWWWIIGVGFVAMAILKVLGDYL